MSRERIMQSFVACPSLSRIVRLPDRRRGLSGDRRRQGMDVADRRPRAGGMAKAHGRVVRGRRCAAGPGGTGPAGGRSGQGVIINGPGRTRNLYPKGIRRPRGPFRVPDPQGSNSGVKLQGLYEIQICDTRGAEADGKRMRRDLPRAELLPRYHHLDDGYAPKVNAARPAGEWQSLDLIFKAPRFDAAGKKVANARFVKVVLNGQVVQEDLELRAPTGHAWRLPEVPRGPLMLQADHGPVAFRNIRVRRLD